MTGHSHNMVFGEVLNRRMDKCVRVKIQLGRRIWSSFFLLGLGGLAMAILLTVSLVVILKLSLWVLLAIIATSIVSFLGLAMATKILTEEEKLVYYHHEIAVMIAVASLLHLLHQPILPYLDVTILGIGMFLAWGRIGCLMVGCCHGRPHHWGVRYSQAHADAGFTAYFVGVRLFPLQAVEAALVLGIVTAGVILSVIGSQPGTAFTVYGLTYNVGRFHLEFLRGDPDRPYILGFSEAQWTSLILTVLLLGAEGKGILPYQMWHWALSCVILFSLLAVYIKKLLRRDVKDTMLHPKHIREIAEAVDLVSRFAVERCEVCQQSFGRPKILLTCTSLGLHISLNRIKRATDKIFLYTLSLKKHPLTEDLARPIARTILQLKHPAESSQLIPGKKDTYHLFVYSPLSLNGSDVNVLESQ